jgi:DNA repair protein RecO (recombination protein O)
MRISLQPAYILHHRPYRETSVILELFTLDYGRIATVAKGVRQNRSPIRSLLQPFIPLLISWQGKGDLMTLVNAEANGQPLRLLGECLLSGLYLNEILVRLLQKHDTHAPLYTIYQNTLLELHKAPLQQKTLRLFEKKLLEELGYGLQVEHEVSAGLPFQADRYYRFHSEHGFELCPDINMPVSPTIFSGKSIIALAQEKLEDKETLKEIKRLMRIALLPLLGQQQLHSRRLFEGMKII